jgi:hypothetical protein
VHGQKNIVVAEFLQTGDINVMHFERFHENRTLRVQIDVSTNIPDKDINRSRVLAEKHRQRTRAVSTVVRKRVTKATPNRDELKKDRRGLQVGKQVAERSARRKPGATKEA